MTNGERQEELWAAIEQNPGKPEVYWPLVVEFVSDWLEREPFDGHRPALPTLAHDWREEQS